MGFCDKTLLKIAIITCFLMMLGCQKEEPIVALIAHRETITLQEFEEAYAQGKPKETLVAVEFVELKNHLEKMIQDRIRILGAYRMGLDKDSVIVKSTESVKNQSLIDRLYQTEIIDKVVKESEIRDYYARTDKKLVVRKILLNLSPQSQPEAEDSVKVLAETIVEELRSGGDFSRLALTHSADQASARRGGLAGEWTWKASPDPLLEAAFMLQAGAISDPIRDSRGYNILKVDKVRTQKRKPYSQVREEIRSQFVREKRKELSDQANSFLQEAMESRGIERDQAGLERLAQHINRWGQLFRDVLLDSLNALPEIEKELVLIRMTKENFRVEDFARRIESSSPRFSLGKVSDSILRKVMEQWLMMDVLTEIAVKRGLHRDYAVKQKVRTVLEQRMVATLNERIDSVDVDPTEEDLKSYYDGHVKQKYTDPEEITVQEVYIRDKETAEKVAQWAKAGRSFDRLVEDYSERPRSYKQKKGVLGPFKKEAWGIIGLTGFTLRAGDIAGPVPLERDQGFSVIKLLERKPEKVNLFSDVQDRVHIDYLADLKKARHDAWMTEMQDKVRVIIFEDVLKGAFRETN